MYNLTDDLKPNNYPHKRHPHENDPNKPKILVGWQGTDDPLNPHNFSFAKRMRATVVVSRLAFMAGAASVIDAAVLPQSSAGFHVSEVVGTLATCSLFPLQSSSQKAHLFTISCLPH